MNPRKAKILVVDDDEILLEIYRVFLRDFELMTARNGEEAIKLFKSFKPDIILMDISMPTMDGVEATKEILKTDPRAVVIGVTAFASQRGDELLKAGAKEIVRKPFNRKGLIEVIKRYLFERQNL
ncbi:MAG: response regulator [Archaeoglobaceae archaeon]|nr:response regulator [Archaeoglobaceae archaeon]MDW7989121.1 response regulator [Archaeoglobaceae archaeon]